MNESALERMCGVSAEGMDYRVPQKTIWQINNALPDEFDAREKWPDCMTIQEIRDQSVCGSCWAFGAAEAMSDRICIHSDEQLHIRLSSEDLLGCCSDCGDGCNGGIPGRAWEFWVHEGIVSGGSYGSHDGCQPYLIAPCTNGHCPEAKTPACQHECQDDYHVSYKQDKHFGKKAYSIGPKEHLIQQEILENGPVEAAFTVYKDFFSYKSGSRCSDRRINANYNWST